MKHLHKIFLLSLLLYSTLFAVTPTLQNSYSYQELQKLQSNDIAGDNLFGFSISLYGEYAVVGAKNADVSGVVDAGAAYIYKKDSNGNYVQLQKVVSPVAQTNAYFGYSVDMDGAYIVIGAYATDATYTDAGSAYIFKNDGSDNFTYIQTLTADNKGSSDFFGVSVAIVGNSVAVASQLEDTGGTDAGAVYIFTNDGSDNFTQTQMLTASNRGASDNFGRSISMDGAYLLVGAPGEDTTTTNSGSVYIFKNSGSGTFSELSMLKASDAGASDDFGNSVAISGDYFVVGAHYADTGYSNAGAAYIFKNDGSDTFTQLQKIQAGDRDSSDYFGQSVAIDGDYVAVGKVLDNGVGSNSGAVYIYKNNGSDVFSQTAKLQAGDAQANDQLGYGLSIINGTVVTGAMYEDTNGANAGSVYVFEPYIQANDYIENSRSVVLNINATNTTGYALSGADSALFDINSSGAITFKAAPDYENPQDANGDNEYDFNLTLQGDVDVVREVRVKVQNQADKIQNSYSYQELQKLQGSAPNTVAYFGESVDMSGDYAVVGASGENTNTGAAYIYKRGVDGNFTLLQRITAADNATNSYFGGRVAIEGEYVVVAKRGDSASGGSYTGSIYIFKNDGSDNFTQTQKLQAADAQGGDYFGTSLGMSGVYIVVGAYTEDQKGTDAGAAYIFKNTNGTFVQTQKLMASNASASDYFGGSVAIDGNYVVVGAPREDTGVTDSGMVYVYKNSAGSFVEIAKLQASDRTTNSTFSSPLAIKGNYIAVGAVNTYAGSLYNAGSVYIFKNDGSDTFTQTQKLQATYPQQNAYFGYSISISDDTLGISAFRADTNGYGSGAVYLFKKSSSGLFRQTRKVQASDPHNDYYFGTTFVLSGGNLLVGANYDGPYNTGALYVFDAYIQADDFAENGTGVVIDINATNATGYTLSGADSALFDINSSGAITFKAAPDYENPQDANGDNEYVFDVIAQSDVNISKEVRVKVLDQVAEIQNSYSFEELQKIKAPTPATGEYYGWSVAIDGDYAVVGAFGYTGSQGAAYIYKRGVDGNFTLLQKIEASDPQVNTYFGKTVAIQGEYVIVGRPLDNSGGDDLGSIYIFKNDGSDHFVQTQKIQAGDKQSSDNYGSSLAISGEYIVVGAPYEDTKGSNAGAAYILKNINGRFVQTQKLMVSNGYQNDNFGNAVSIDGEYLAVAAPYKDVGTTDDGAVYIYKNEGGSFAEVARLSADVAIANDHFGDSVSIDGDYVAVGASGDTSGGSNSGAAYIFKNDGSDNFSQVQKLKAADPELNAYLGWEIIIDGKYVVVNASRRDGNYPGSGAIYMFENDGSDVFTQVDKIQASDSKQDDYFGNFIALSHGTLVVGVPYEDSGVDRSGAVYFFKPFVKSVAFAENGTGSVIDINATNATGYTLSGTDSALFEIDSSGVVTFKSAPDYENPQDANGDNEYVFDVVTSGEVTKEEVHVKVSNVIAELQNSYTLQELQKNMSDTPAQGAYFGSAVVLHGDYALIAEVGANSGAGAVYLYERGVDGSFTKKQKLIPNDAQAGDHFGRSPVMDGEYIVIGAADEDAKGTDAGAAYVFKRGANGTYTQTQKLLAADGTSYDYFGTAVALQGEYLVVSATGDDDVVGSSGSLYIFKNINGTFVQVQKALAATPRGSSNFGGALAMDGDFLAVGASNESLSATATGVVHIFKNIGGSFVEVQEMRSSPYNANEGFGSSVALQGDTLVVGAAYDDYGTPTNVTDAGAVYILKKNANDDTFVQTQKLVADSSDRDAYSDFGGSVSVSGEYLAVGGYRIDSGLTDAGVVYVYKKSGSGLYEKSTILKASDRAANDSYGTGVAIDNGTVLIGAPYKAYNGNTIVGAAYFYTPKVAVSSFEENGIGAVIDINATNTPNYSLIGADSAYFEVDSDGVLKFIGEPNYENPQDANGDNIYEVSVVANGESTIVQNFSVEVTNLINESKIALPSSRWTDILKGSQYDPTADLQVASAIDLLGDANNTLLYLEYNDYVLADPTDDRMELRVRTGKNTVDSNGNLSGVIWLGMDVDLDGDIDLFLVLDGSSGTNKLYVYGAGASANNSPNTTSLGNGVLLGVLATNNLNIDTVKNIDGSSYVNLGNDGTNDDKLVSFTFLFDNLKTIANAMPLTNENANIATLNNGAGLTKDTLMKFLVGTSPSLFTFVGDIGGYGANDNYDTLYPIQGVYSDAMSLAALRDADIPDTTAPTIDHTTPQDDAIEVPKDTNITLLFSELIHKGSGNILIKDASNSVVESIDVSSNAVSVFGGSATITPSATLALGTPYHVEIDAGAFKDDANNTYAGISNATTLNFTIVTNKAPVLHGNSFAISENNTIGTQVGVVTASDPENDTITYSITAGDTNGDFDINSSTGAISLAKELNAYLVQNYSLTVQAQDTSALATQAVVSISVTDKVDAPVAVADAATLDEDHNATINLTANDTDKDFNLNSAGIIVSKKPDHGSLTLDSAGFAYYVADANYYGSDYFTYSVSDTTGLRSNDVNVTLTINPVNDTPVTINGVINTPEDTAANRDLATYASDVDGAADISSYTIVTPPTYGSVALTGSKITYIPNLNYYGIDSFTFSVTDGNSTVSNSSTISINVAAVNDIPVARSEYKSLDEDTLINIDVLANDSDDGNLDPATVAVLNQPAHGSAVVETNGTITYTPDANWTGFDSFEYTVKDDGLASFPNENNATGVLISNAATVSLRVNPINDAPVAVDDSFTLDEDSSYLMNLIANDIDIDTQLNGRYITLLTQTTHGRLNLQYDGLVRYTPSKDYAGSDSFTYKISDGEYNSSVATVSLTISNVNDAPTITTAKNIDVNENTLNDYILTAVDIENNTPFTYSIEGGADAALFSVYGGNKLTFQSAPDFEAPQDANGDNVYEVTIAVRDSQGATGRKTLYFKVLNAPLSFSNNGGATTASVSVDENNASVTTVIASSGDTESVTYSISGGADQSEFSIDATTGELIFVHPKDFESNGATTYVVEVTATNGSSSVTQTITVSIANVNEAPTFTSNGITTATENSLYTYTPTFNDVDGDEVVWSASHIPSFLSVSSASSETVVAGTGEIPVSDGTNDTPDAQPATNAKIFSSRMYVDEASSQIFFIDIEEYGIRYVDGSGNIESFFAGDGSYYTLNPSAVAYNAAEDVVYVANYGSGTVEKIARDGTRTVIASDLRYYIQSLFYDKANNLLYVGTRSAIYKVDLTDTNTATNKTRIVGNGQFRGSYLDTGVPATSLVNNVTSMVLDSSGRLIFSDRFNHLIRRVDFTNNTIETIAGKQGYYTYSGDGGLAVDATFGDPISVAVDIDDNIYVAERTDRSIRKITADGKIEREREISAYGFIESLAINKNTGDMYVQLTYKILKFSNASTLSGTPTVSGVYDVNLTVTDGKLTTHQNYQITVADVNDAPVVSSRTFVIGENSPVGRSLGIIAATDEDGVSPSVDLIGSPEVLTYSIVAGNTNNDFSIDASTGEIKVAKELNAYTTSRYYLTVLVEDDGGDGGTADVMVTISNYDDTPVALADSATVDEDNNVTIDLVANDTDRDFNINSASVVVTQAPLHGRVELNASGAATYIPDADYYGADSFSYKVYDDTSLASNEANVTLSINAVNDTPVTVSGVLQTDEDTNLTTRLNDFASDADGMSDISSYEIVTAPSNGVATVVANELKYVPNSNFYGFDTLTFRVIDGNGSISNVSTLHINVAAVNDIPIANEDSASLNEDASVNLAVLANDTDDGNLDTSTVEILNQPAHGSAVVQGDGTITYTPDANWNGSDSFTYSVKDDGLITNGVGSAGVLISNAARVSLVVNPVNDAPVAVNDSFTLDEDSLYMMNPIANDTDVDNTLDAKNITLLTQTAHGTLKVLANGLVQYAPAKDYNGVDSFTYKVSDADVNSSVATVNLTITSVNDAPRFVTTKEQNVSENTTAIVSLSAADVENNTPFTYTLLDAKDSSFFSLNGANLSFATPRNYEAPEDANGDNVYSVDLNITDSLGASTTKTFNVTVQNVDETPVATTDPATNKATTDVTTPSGNSATVEYPASSSGNIGISQTTVEPETQKVTGTTNSATSTIATQANGDTNSSVVGEKSSTVVSGDINKTVTMDENGTVKTTLDDTNTTITQNAPSGSVSVDTKTQSGAQKSTNSLLPASDVSVSDDGTVVIKGSATNNGSESNVTVAQNPNGETNATVSGTNGNTTLTTGTDLNTTTTLDENGSVRTEFSSDAKETSITQTNFPSVTIDTTVHGGGNTQVKVDGNATVSVDNSGKVSVSQDGVTSDGTTYSKSIISDESGGTSSSVTIGGKTTTINTPANENSVTIANRDDGTTELNATKTDGTTTQVQTDENGALSVKTQSQNGDTTSSSSYPAGATVTLNENNTTVVTQGDTNRIVTSIDNDGNIVVTSTTPPASLTQAKFPKGSSVSVDEHGVVTVHDTSGKTIVLYENGDVSVTEDGVTTDYSNYPSIETSIDGELVVDGAVISEGSTTSKYTDFDGDGIFDYYDTDDDNDNISDIDEGNGAVDTDGDGAPDSQDLDSDNDGILDIIEGSIDSDNDGIPNFRDLDSDGDGKLDIYEGMGDDDLDGIANYLDANDNGSDAPIDNGDGTETVTIKKAEGSGDDKVTSITTPNGSAYTREEADDNSTQMQLDTPNVDINITADGGLDINMDETNGKHNISVANPGSDIKIEDNGDMSITTPRYTNSDLSTCQHDLRISYDGSDMITKHILGQSSGEDIITTIVMKIPDANISITSDNRVINEGNFVNANTKAVQVIASVSCDGSVSTATTIEDVNTTFVAINKAGSTIVIDRDGNVDTTTSLKVSDVDANLLEGLHFRVDSLTGDVNASKITKNGTTSEVTYTDAQIYLAGSKIVSSGSKISDIKVDLSNVRLVKVAVTDENNKSTTSTMSIDATVNSADISRISNGETSAVTTKVRVDSGFILVDNFLDGKTKHVVNVGGVTTEAHSNLVGTDVTVSKDKVVTSYANNLIELSVTALKDATASHKLVLNGVTTQARSEIIGAKTFISGDANANAQIVTKVETTNANNQHEVVEVSALSDGSAVHKIRINGVTTQATSELAGANTVIKSSGEVDTNVSVAGGATHLFAVADANGTAKHRVAGAGFVSKAEILLQGAHTLLKADGATTTVETKETQCVLLHKLVYDKAKIITDLNGKTVTEFVKYNCSDDSESEELMTNDTTTPFAPNNDITLKKVNGAMRIIVVTPVTDNLKF